MKLIEIAENARSKVDDRWEAGSRLKHPYGSLGHLMPMGGKGSEKNFIKENKCNSPGKISGYPKIRLNEDIKSAQIAKKENDKGLELESQTNNKTPNKIPFVATTTLVSSRNGIEGNTYKEYNNSEKSGRK